MAGGKSSFANCKWYCKQTCYNTQYAKPFLGWSLCNIIRYIIVGYFIFYTNHKNNGDVNKITKDCCGCYWQSMSQTDGNTKRFDLSYCIKDCADCNTCKDSGKTKDIDQCPPNYAKNYKFPYFNMNWYANDVTGCEQAKQSLTSMGYFLKSYKYYGRFSLGITISYSLLNLLFILLTFLMNDMCNTFFRWLWIYNIFITELCLYLFFKPHQYYQQVYEMNIKCQVNSLSETFEQIMKYTIFCSSALVFLHCSWILFWIIYYICKCIKSYRHDHRERAVSISMHENERIQQKKTGIYIELGSNKTRNYKKFTWFWGCIGVVVFVAMLCFLILVIITSVTMLMNEHIGKKKKIQIWIVSVLLALSLFDSPWLWRQVIQCINSP